MAPAPAEGFVVSEPPLALTVSGGSALPAGGRTQSDYCRCQQLHPVDFDDTISVGISGTPAFQSVTDDPDHRTFNRSGTRLGHVDRGRGRRSPELEFKPVPEQAER